MRLSTVHLRLTCICVLLSVLLMFAACGGGVGYPARLVQADSLLYDNPDSALHILESYNDSLKQASTPVRMYYDLLLTTAKDKCYITHTSDSTALQLVSYYEKHGPDDKLALAYYITGRVYDDLQNTPVALEYYQKAVDEASKYDDYRLLMFSYNQMGSLYLNQKLEKESVTAYKRSYEYSLKINKTQYLPYLFRNLGRAYTMTNNVDSTLYYYNKACELGDSMFIRYFVVNELTSVYLQLGDLKNARRMLSYDKDDYNGWAYYYDKTGKTDSAELCYKKSLAHDPIQYKMYSFRKLAEYAEIKGNPTLGLYYLKEAVKCNDTVTDKNLTSEVKRIESLYNYEKIKSERDKVVLEKEMQKYLNFALSVLLVLISVILLFLYYRIKYKQQHQFNQEQRTQYLKDMSKSMEIRSIEDFPLCFSIKKNASKDGFKLLANNWETFHLEINSMYPNFVTRLRTLYPHITDIELTVCCLVKLGIRNTDMANILCHGTNSISNIRKRLYEKIHGTHGSARLLDDFIINF